MKRKPLLCLLWLATLLLSVGCAPEPIREPKSNEFTKDLGGPTPAEKSQERIEAEKSATSSVQPDAVAPVGSGAAGGVTPMTGAESVDGAGMGGVGSAAKDQARDAAAAASSSSAAGADSAGP